VNETQIILSELGALSYIGIFVVALLTNVFVPVPEEVILLCLGYLAGIGKLSAFILVPIVTLGLLVSDITIYYLSKRGNKFVKGFYNKFFAKRVSEKEEWVEKHINKVIFFSRFMIQLRFLGPFLAGNFQVKFKRFLAYDMLALVIYVPLYIFIGWFFHNRILEIVNNVNKAKNIALIIVATIAGFSLLRFLYRAVFIKAIK